MISALYPIFQHWSTNGSVWLLSDLHFNDPDCSFIDQKLIRSGILSGIDSIHRIMLNQAIERKSRKDLYTENFHS